MNISNNKYFSQIELKKQNNSPLSSLLVVNCAKLSTFVLSYSTRENSFIQIYHSKVKANDA